MPTPSAPDDAAPRLPAAAPERGVAIATRGLRRVFDGGVEALAPLDVDVAPGSFVALLGPSGCGKSTLLRLVAGLDRPSAGTLSLAGPRMKPSIAFVFQDPQLMPWRRVLENAALPLELAGVPKTDRLERARAALEEVGLGDAATRYPRELSGGMRMRVSLARALVTEPDLLLLDEPFAALDELTRHRLDDQLRALWRARGMTVLFVTHAIGEAVYLAERALVFSRRPATVIDDRTLSLPVDRDFSLRATPAFAAEEQALYRALTRGDAS